MIRAEPDRFKSIERSQISIVISPLRFTAFVILVAGNLVRIVVCCWILREPLARRTFDGCCIHKLSLGSIPDRSLTKRPLAD